jgi:hypothetical protein
MENIEWSEPELIVLVRSKPEEGVLSVCKGPNENVATPADVYGWCLSDSPIQCAQFCTNTSSS